MSFLGIDYGSKRIGLAVSGPGRKIASPLATVKATGRMANDVRAVLSRAEGYDIDAFVVGLPLNMDGTAGEQAKLAKRFGDELARATGHAVHYQDERLSSISACELLAPAELTRKKRKAHVDRVAAQVILQDFLDTREGGEVSV